MAERSVGWRAQNLDVDAQGRPQVIGLRHGRAWLHLPLRTSLGCEWLLPSSRFHLGLSLNQGGERTVAVALCVPPASLFLSLESWPLARWIGEIAHEYHLLTAEDWTGLHRDLSLRIFDWAVWWSLWRNPDHGRQDDPRGGSWHPFGHPGERLGAARQVESRVVKIELPEKTYLAVASRQVAVTRGTPRWPFSRPWISQVTLDFTPFGPVPIPGKGENSWDCGEDAVFSTSFRSETIDEAIPRFLISTSTLRAHRGGEGWKPRCAKKEAEVPGV